MLICSRSTLRTAPKRKTSGCLKTLVSLQRQLHAWWNELTNDALCKATMSQSDNTRRGIHLKLEYCLVRMFVGRVFILPQDRPWHTRSTPTPADLAASKDSLRAALVTDCVEAAMSVIDICQLLRNSIGLARASYTEFSSCRAALLVITTQCLSENSKRFRQALRDGLEMLKEMSAGSLSAHSEASLIEAFEDAIVGMSTAMASGSFDGSSSEYAKFKRWERLCKLDTPSLGLESATAQDEETCLAPQLSQPAGGDWVDETALIPSSTPFFGVDGNFAPFPQNVNELSAFLGTDFGLSFGRQAEDFSTGRSSPSRCS